MDIPWVIDAHPSHSTCILGWDVLPLTRSEGLVSLLLMLKPCSWVLLLLLLLLIFCWAADTAAADNGVAAADSKVATVDFDAVADAC